VVKTSATQNSSSDDANLQRVKLLRDALAAELHNGGKDKQTASASEKKGTEVEGTERNNHAVYSGAVSVPMVGLNDMGVPTSQSLSDDVQQPKVQPQAEDLEKCANDDEQGTCAPDRSKRHPTAQPKKNNKKAPLVEVVPPPVAARGAVKVSRNADAVGEKISPSAKKAEADTPKTDANAELQMLKDMMLHMQERLSEQGKELERLRSLPPQLATNDSPYEQLKESRVVMPTQMLDQIHVDRECDLDGRSTQQQVSKAVASGISERKADQAIDVVNKENQGRSENGKTSPSPPAPPDMPNIEAVTKTSVRIWWAVEHHVPEITAYALVVHDGARKYYDPRSGTLSATKANGGALATSVRSVVIEGISAGATCKAELAAMNEVGWSQYSQASKSVILESPGPPPTPNLEVINADSLRVSWAGVKHSPPVLGYSIAVFNGKALHYVNALNGTLAADGAGLGPVPAKVTSLLVKGLTVDVGHSAAVAAMNKFGWGSYSSFSEALAIESPPVPEQPAVEAVDGVSIRVSWLPSKPILPVTGYGLLVTADDSTFMYFDAGSGRLVASSTDAGSVAADATSVVVCGLDARVRYKARVSVQNSAGWSRYSVCSNAIMLDVPGVPERPTLKVAGLDTISVEWSSAMHVRPPVTSFAITIKCDGSIKYYDARTATLVDDPSNALSVPGDAQLVVVKGVQSGVKYKAKIASRNGTGWGSYSAFSEPVLVEAPGRLAQPTLEVLDGMCLRVTWVPPQVACGVSGYAVVVRDREVRYYDAGIGALVSSCEGLPAVPADVTSVILQDLSACLPYQVKVAARNGAGWGSYSAFSDALGILEPPPPAAPSVRVVESGCLRVSWQLVEHMPCTTGYLIAVHDGELKYWSSLDGRLHCKASDASLTSSATISIAINDLRIGACCKAQVAAVNAAGSSLFSAFSETVVMEENDEMRFWPALRLDLAPEVPCPRTWQSSQYAYVRWPAADAKTDFLGLLQELLASFPAGCKTESAALLRSLTAGGCDTCAGALAAVWLSLENRSSPLFVWLNRILLEDDEDQLASWAPILQDLVAYISDPAPSCAMTVWRGSRLTRSQVLSLATGEVIRPPMFVSASESKHFAAFFQDIYLVKLIVPAECRSARLVGRRENYDELVLLPYTALRVLAVRDDNIIEVEVVNCRDDEVHAARAFPI